MVETQILFKFLNSRSSRYLLRVGGILESLWATQKGTGCRKGSHRFLWPRAAPIHRERADVVRPCEWKLHKEALMNQEQGYG